MKKTSVATLAVVALLLSTSLASVKIGRASGVFPTSDTPTLLTSLSPPNVTLGQNVTWLIWTDINCSGLTVSLEIVDLTNSTTVFEENATLGTLNKCGSLKKDISTVGFVKDRYKFTARMVIDGMTMESSKYLDFRVVVPTFSIYGFTSPFDSIPGEGVRLSVGEGIYPYIEAVTNITVYNTTDPDLWHLHDLTIPSANGSRNVDIPTGGLDAGFYNINITATSAMGRASALSIFELLDIIVSVSEYSYYIGDDVNVSIRTYTSVSQAGLKIFQFTFPPSPPVVDESVTLSSGRGFKLYNSSTWPPGSYTVMASVTVDGRAGLGSTYFSLKAFDAFVQTDKYYYAAGEFVNITTSTTPPQANALFNLTITNSSDEVIWTHGPDHLGSNGAASVLFDTTGLPPDSYKIEAIVNNTRYEDTDSEYFQIPLKKFNIYATIEPYTNTGYAMPLLNTTVVLAQTNANITIEVSWGSTAYYTFTKDNFDISAYYYFLPAPGLPNGSYSVHVSVTSAIGTNSTYDYFHYSNGRDTDGDGLPDSQERTIGTGPNNPDTDGDGFFDGIEVFHGSDPLDPHSVIPEQIFVQIIALVCTTPLIYLVAKRKSKLLKS